MSSQTAVQAELPVLRLRRHGRRLTLPVLLLILLAAAAGFWVGALPEAWMNWCAGIGALVLAVLLGVCPVLAWLSSRTIITNRRVILRRGFFVHRRSEIPLIRVRSIESTRGPIQRVLGSGDIRLLTGAEDTVTLRDVPGCAVAVDALQELIERNFALETPGESAAHPAHARPRAARNDADATTVLPDF